MSVQTKPTTNGAREALVSPRESIRWAALAGVVFFVLLLVVEAYSFKHTHDDELVGYEGKDTRTSLAMGLGNVGINVLWKFAVLAAYVALYELTPRAPFAMNFTIMTAALLLVLGNRRVRTLRA